MPTNREPQWGTLLVVATGVLMVHLVVILGVIGIATWLCLAIITRFFTGA